MTEIRFDQVRKAFGGNTVVKDLSLTIAGGEFFTFVGPSGCGKSTLLNLVAGLEEPDSGTISFDGRSVSGLDPRERDVAMVFQSYALYPHMTVFENIAFPLRMRKRPKGSVDGDVGRVAELLGIKELLQRRPKELSGGQRQRVALGRAIVRQPKVFLMDEPLSNLDARLRIDMRAELKRLHRELNTTTIYVTHDQGEAMGLSDRLAVLSEGQVQQVGPPGAVYRHPANLFVAGFIGSPPMNLLPAAVSAVDASTVEVNGLVVPTPCAASLSATGRVTAGIRPEDVLVSLARREGSVEIEVLVVEPAGPSSWIDAMWDGVRIRGTASPEEPVRAGEPAHMTLRTEHMVFFDRRTGGLLC